MVGKREKVVGRRERVVGKREKVRSRRSGADLLSGAAIG
jgi:hypothetical protein